MTSSPEVQAYVRSVQENADLKRTTAGQPSASLPFPPRKPRAGWYNYTTRSAAVYDDLDDVFNQEREDSSHKRRAVCVIEAIDWTWLGRLGHKWKIDPAFFADHGTNPDVPDGGDLWSAMFPLWHDGLGTLNENDQTSRSVHIDGVYEYHSWSGGSRALSVSQPITARTSTFSRVAWVPLAPYAPSCTTRVSYHRVHPFLCESAIVGKLECYSVNSTRSDLGRPAFLLRTSTSFAARSSTDSNCSRGKIRYGSKDVLLQQSRWPIATSIGPS